MRRLLIILAAAILATGAVWYYNTGGGEAEATVGASATNAGASAPGRGGATGRTAMTVDTALVTRQEVVDSITVVGNLIGEATVDVVSRVAGRLDQVPVKLGDRVTRGQVVARIEDREIKEQINQAIATLDVNKANVSQRENEVQVQQNALDRARTSYERGLVAKQLLEDAEARFNAAGSQLNVAKAQQAQTQFRIDELRITLANTTVLSPIEGFVSRRNLDAGGFAGTTTVILTIVDLSSVRMVGNLVEKGFRKVVAGVPAIVTVDTFPGEEFTGQVSRVAPVFDPATRTAQMEIEVPNPGYRLKPGMYARVRLTVDRRQNSLTVPRNAVVDVEGRRGVFTVDNQAAKFVEVKAGISDGERIEIVEGLQDGQRVITTGALALRDGDRISVAESSAKGNRGAKPSGGRNPGNPANK